METLFFYLLIPLAFGALQFFLIWRRCPRWQTMLPLCGIGLCEGVCLFAVFGVISLPSTYWIDRGSWFAFPDYAYAALYGLPALFGLLLGGLLGWTYRKP